MATLSTQYSHYKIGQRTVFISSVVHDNKTTTCTNDKTIIIIIVIYMNRLK